MGHATRCVPVINELLENDAEVVLGADGIALEFLRDYFPGLKIIRIPGYGIKYPKSGNMTASMLSQIPRILNGIRREHHHLLQIIRDEKIQSVISDNRFGMWSDEIYSVYITHQIRIKGPGGSNFMEPVLAGMHGKFWKKYRECWIPDYPGIPNLSGELGHISHPPAGLHYIGPLSRFSGSDGTEEGDLEPALEMLFLLSGPEPQRTIFESIILKELDRNRSVRATIIRGQPAFYETTEPFPLVTMHSHLPDEKFRRLVRTAEVIVCRPGYSTLMDLAQLGKRAILVPTPGQTEQQYLARYHSAGKSFARIEQESFTISKAMEMGRSLVDPEYNPPGQDYLRTRIRNLMDII